MKIYTTLDAPTQAAATKALMDKIPATDPSGVLTAAVTMEPGSGKVISIAQNRYYSPDPGPGRSEVSYGVDRVYGGSPGFQVGSTFKPFTLATWLSKGKGLYDTVSGDQTLRARSDFTTCGKAQRGEPYEFYNSESDKKPSSISVMDATYNSVNTAYVDIESRLDMCDLQKVAEGMGVRLSTPAVSSCYADGVSSTRVPNYCPSLTLGAFEISPMTMANAYATFAADGRYCTPNAINQIKDRNGAVIPVGATNCRQALDPEVAHGVTYALKRTITQGTAASISPVPWPAAGKTGTTDASIRTWFTGYTKDRATSVVVADPKIYANGTLQDPGPKTLSGREIGGKYYSKVYGATIAAPLWKSIMQTAMQGESGDDWPNPRGKMLEGSGIRVIDVVGRSIAEARAILQGQGFRVRVGSPKPSDLGPDKVARTSPPGGSRLSPESVVVIYPGNGKGGGDTPAPADKPKNPRDNQGNGNNG